MTILKIELPSWSNHFQKTFAC